MNVRGTTEHKVVAYLAERRQAGYRLTIAGQQLLAFARFTDASGYRGPLTIEIASRWAHATRGGRRLTAARRIELLRPFASFCRSWDDQSEIPPLRLLGPGHRRLTPHIYNGAQLCLLMHAARRLPPAGGLRGETCATIVGLMAACGLRISEATGLRREDVDLDQGCLRIRAGKFGKERLVPLHPSTRSALRRYASRRDRDPRCAERSEFFLFEPRRPLTTQHMHYAFRIVRRALRHRPCSGHGRFRLQDLRHTFVCRRIEHWHRQGVDVDRHMLALSTYVGHVSPTETYWYVTATPQLMALAAQRLAPIGLRSAP